MSFSLVKSSRTLVILVSIAIILVLAVFNFGSWIFIHQIEDSLESELEKRLKAVANITAELVEDSRFVTFYNRQQELSARLFITSTLERLPDAIDIQQVFLMNRSRQVLASSNALLVPPGEEVLYLLDDSTEILQAWQGETIASAIRVIGESKFKTAYAPVKDSDENIICLVVVEANAGFFQLLAKFKKGLVIGGIASFVVLLIFAAVLVSVITLFMRTQDDLRRSERLAAMGQMAATVAHEIRNPLSIIKGTAEVLQQKYEQREKPDELFDFIPSEVRRLNRLVSDFLNFARNRDIVLRKNDIIQTVKQAVNMVQKSEESSQIKWVITNQQTTLLIAYDEDAITQVLINLLFNASQAMKGSGTIEVIIEKHSHEIHIAVRDNGPGLPDSAEKIFEPFYTTKTKGSGLGLAVCKQFIERHKGRMTAESPKGKGTTMHMWLPG